MNVDMLGGQNYTRRGRAKPGHQIQDQGREEASNWRMRVYAMVMRERSSPQKVV